MDEETQQAVLQLDWAIDKVAQALDKCGQLVNEDRLDGQVVMLKINELAARLMSGATS